MAELAIQSVRQMTHTDWLPSHAISFSYRAATFGREISEFIWRQTNQILVCFTKDLQQQMGKDLVESLNDDFKYKTR